MIAYKYDENMRYIGTQECQLDPLESQMAGHDIWLLPAECTYVAPLEPQDGFYVVWNGEFWEYEEIQSEPEAEPEKYELTEEELRLQKIEQLKLELANTDYKTLKFVDGALTEEEYAEVRAQRAELRRQINELEMTDHERCF